MVSKAEADGSNGRDIWTFLFSSIPSSKKNPKSSASTPAAVPIWPGFQRDVASVAEKMASDGAKGWRRRTNSCLLWLRYSTVRSGVGWKLWTPSDSSSHHPRRQIPSEILQPHCHIIVNPLAKSRMALLKSLSASPSLIQCHINVTGLIKDHTHLIGCRRVNTSFLFKSPTVLRCTLGRLQKNKDGESNVIIWLSGSMLCPYLLIPT